MRKKPPQGKVKCEVCDKELGRKYLKIHMRLHTGEKLTTCESPRFNCSVCKKGFLELHKYRQHMYSHVPRILKACKYEHCGRSYIYKKHLIAHYKQHFITN